MQVRVLSGSPMEPAKTDETLANPADRLFEVFTNWWTSEERQNLKIWRGRGVGTLAGDEGRQQYAKDGKL